MAGPLLGKHPSWEVGEALSASGAVSSYTYFGITYATLCRLCTALFGLRRTSYGRGAHIPTASKSFSAVECRAGVVLCDDRTERKHAAPRDERR